MTPFHWVLATIGLAIVLLLAVLLVYDMLAMQRGWPTLSEMGDRLHRPAAFALGLAVGFLLGAVCGHLWWPRARP